MGDRAKIEWTETPWNPIVGCSVVSPGCTNCYAMRFVGHRLDGYPKTPHYAGTTQRGKADPVWTGKLALAPEKMLLLPLGWKRPRMICAVSMGDLFHESVPDEWIDKVFAVMALARQHTFQVLTKRAERMRQYMTQLQNEPARDTIQRMVASIQRHPLPQFWAMTLPRPNVWLGVSVEDQRRADERIPYLLETPAAVRFICAEPLIGPIDFANHLGGVPLHWIIVGGETGAGARPMRPDWVRSIRDQCQASNVPFFFKQWGEWQSWPGGIVVRGSDTSTLKVIDPEWTVSRVGKRAAGRLLDGREHNGMPEGRALISPHR